MSMRLGKSVVGLVFACAFLLTACFAPSESEAKVGFLDIQRLVKESRLGKQATKEIAKLTQAKEQEIGPRLKELNDLKAEVESSGAKMSEADKREKVEEFQRLNKEYQRLVQDSKEEIAKQDREKVAAILKKAEEVLVKVAKRDKYLMIIKDPNVLSYLDPSVDITAEVIKGLDALK
jgi:outer membrane protein